MRLERLLERLAAALLEVLAGLLREELADLVAGARRLHEVQPVARRPPLLLRRQHLDELARLQGVVQRDDAAVHLGADAAVADVGVHRVGEVERCRSGRQALDLALRREHVDLVGEQVDPKRLHELLGVARVVLPVHQLRQPRDRSAVLRGGGLVLVQPVGGDAVLGRLVHLVRAHLDLERLALRPDHGRVQGLVHVELGHGHVVLEPPRHRLPQRVDHADRAVAVLDRADDDPHRGQVVDLVELATLLGHLRVDRVEVLGAP